MDRNLTDQPIAVIVGARPNFVKIARLVPALKDAGMRPRLVHTGQHYDKHMSQSFFDELEIPHPDVNLGVGSGTHIWQITEVMRRLEGDFTQERPKAVLVVGDVNSTLAAALTATKLGIPVGHVEAGLRSGDREMPEEINRLVVDAVSDWLFTSEPTANENLAREGVPGDKIFFVGNVMIDTLRAHLPRARALRPYEEFGVEARNYAVLTLHRPSNVDVRDHLESIVAAVVEVAGKHPVLFPLHPRTRNRLEHFNVIDRLRDAGVRLLDPLPYLAMLGLMDSARLVMTDSGGIQEETTALGVPCLTMRENTERPVTIEQGGNQLVGWKATDILQAVHRLESSEFVPCRIPDKWDGEASSRIAQIIATLLKER